MGRNVLLLFDVRGDSTKIGGTVAVQRSLHLDGTCNMRSVLQSGRRWCSRHCQRRFCELLLLLSTSALLS